MTRDSDDHYAARLKAIADEVVSAEAELTNMIDTGLGTARRKFSEERWLAIRSSLEEQLNIRIKRWSFDEGDPTVRIHYEVL